MSCVTFFGKRQPKLLRGVPVVMRYGLVICRETQKLAFCYGLIGFLGRAVADETAIPTSAGATNSYISLTNRNAFGIKPPPTPPPPELVAPVVAPPNLFLTGFSHLNGLKKAYLVVNKPNARQADYLAVEEGYDNDGLQILAIDTRKQTVLLKNSGTELTLNFKDNGLKPNSVPAGAPGVVNPPGVAPYRGVPPPPAVSGQTAAAGGSAGPTIIGRGGVNATPVPVANAVVAEGVAAEVTSERQLPRRGGVYLGGATATSTGVDHGGLSALPLAPTVPGQLHDSPNNPPRPGLVVPPVPQIIRR